MILRAMIIVFYVLVLTSCGSNSSSEHTGEQEHSIKLIAEAGSAQSVLVQTIITLEGSANVVNGIKYSWSFSLLPTGSNPTIFNDNTPNPSFTAEIAGQYVLLLTITDEQGARASDSVIITVQLAEPEPDVSPVIMEISDQRVLPGDSYHYSPVLVQGNNVRAYMVGRLH